MKWSWPVGLVVLMACAGISVGYGQGSSRDVAAGGVSIVDAVDSALRDFPAVMAATARSDAAKAVADRAAGAWWPSLGAGLSGTQYEEPMLVSPIHGLTPGVTPPFDRTLVRGWVELTYTLFDGGARDARIREARELSAAAGEDLTSARQELTRTVAVTYLETLSRRSLLAAQESRIDALGAERDRVRQLAGADRASEIDLLRVEAALASAEADRVQAGSLLDVSMRDLARLTGLPAEQTRPEQLAALKYTGSLLPDRNRLAEDALRASTTLEVSRHELAAAEARVSAARGTRLPRADLAGTYAEYASADGDHAGEWNLGLRLTVPLFTGGQLSSGIEAAEAQKKAAAENVRLVELQISGQVDRAVSALEGARVRVESLGAALSRSERIVQIERLRLRTGTGTHSDYLRAEADLLEVRSRLIEARHGELVSRMDLARLSGRLDRDWLHENLEALQ